MATIDWPAGLIPQTMQLSLRKAGTQFASPFNGTLQAVDFLGERWVLSANLAPQQRRDPAGLDAFCARMAGGVERVRVWPFHTGGVPRGTLRGAPVLSAAATRGQAALSLSGARAGANLLSGGGFEVDAGFGLAVGWQAYSNGSTGTITYSLVAGASAHGALVQRISASALGGAATDRAGMFANVGGVQELAPYSMSFSVNSSSACRLRAFVDWLGIGGSFLGVSQQAWVLPVAGWQRLEFAAQSPAGALGAFVYLWLEQATSPPAAVQAMFDEVQFEMAPVASPFAGRPSLRAGDFIGAGGQLFQVAADTTLSDLGAGSVPVINRVRGPIALGSAVTWYRPTCEMVLPAMQAGPVQRPGVIESTALDLVEVW